MNSRLVSCFFWALAALAMYSQAFAHPGGLNTTTADLPPEGVYLTPADVHAMYSGPDLLIVLSDIKHRPFRDRLPTYPPEGEHHDFFSELTGHGECTGNGCAELGIPPSFPVEMQGRVQTIALGKGPTDPTGTFQTEMLSMSLSGIGGIMVRESPTLPSLGVTSITDLGSGGPYHIDSFFDVFTELSLNGGQSWLPSAGPTPVLLVPEPASVALLALGVLGFAGLIRRRR